jgi:hypothetical protein
LRREQEQRRTPCVIRFCVCVRSGRAVFLNFLFNSTDQIQETEQGHVNQSPNHMRVACLEVYRGEEVFRGEALCRESIAVCRFLVHVCRRLALAWGGKFLIVDVS